MARTSSGAAPAVRSRPAPDRSPAAFPVPPPVLTVVPHPDVVSPHPDRAARVMPAPVTDDLHPLGPRHDVNRSGGFWPDRSPHGLTVCEGRCRGGAEKTNHGYPFDRSHFLVPPISLTSGKGRPFDRPPASGEIFGTSGRAPSETVTRSTSDRAVSWGRRVVRPTCVARGRCVAGAKRACPLDAGARRRPAFPETVRRRQARARRARAVAADRRP